MSVNPATVQALSNALAGALSPLLLQQSPQTATATAISVTGQSSTGTTTTSPTTSASGSSTAGSDRPNHILPSYLKRKAASSSASKSKKAKTVTSWDKDIICLPKEYKLGENVVPYPRGKYRARLGREGLVGKVHLTSVMTVDEVKMEIRSVFERAMGGNHSFPFTYLQATGGGSRSLSIPSVSASFQWTAHQVAKLGNQRNTIYILAEDSLVLPNEEVTDDEEDASVDQSEQSVTRASESYNSDAAPQSSRVTQSCTQESVTHTSHNSDHLYRKYVDLVDLTVSSEDSDIEDLPPAFTSSTTAHTSDSAPVDSVVIKHLLQQHRQSVINSVDTDDVQRVHVRRTHIFTDSLRQFSRNSFDVSKILRVTFVGESAVDDGGPRREYFQLLLREIACKSCLFGGWPDHVVPIHNVDALVHDKYFVVGKMLATALVQGGQPPVFFAGAVADFLVSEMVKSPVDLDDIPDFEVRQCLQKVAEVNTTDELQSLVNQDSFDFRFTCGYTKPTQQITLSDKHELLRSIWLHHVLYNPHAELVQLRKGFRETLQVHRLTCFHETEVRALLAYSTVFDVSVSYLQDSFAVQYSDNGSNNRTKEEAIVFHWLEYVSICNESNGRPVSLANILQFFSGASKLPAAGFDETPKISFTSSDCLPYASTCALTITFPRSLGLLSFDEFQEKMDFCIQGSFGFGSV